VKTRGQRNHVWVEVSGSGLPIRIIKHWSEASQLPSDLVRFVNRTWAVGEIRRQVFERDNYECRRCGKRGNAQTLEMDEFISRGEGGMIGLDNSWTLCHSCHTGSSTSEHGNRRLMFSKNEERR